MQSPAASSHALEDKSNSSFFSRGLGCVLAVSSQEQGVSKFLSQCYPATPESLPEGDSFPHSPLQQFPSLLQARPGQGCLLRWELSPVGAMGNLLWLEATVTASWYRPAIFPSYTASTQGAVVKRSLHTKGKHPAGIFRVKG